MAQVTTAGIDLAKKLFALHGVDGFGKVQLRKTVRRDQLLETVAAGLTRLSTSACSAIVRKFARAPSSIGTSRPCSCASPKARAWTTTWCFASTTATAPRYASRVRTDMPRTTRLPSICLRNAPIAVSSWEVAGEFPQRQH